MNTKPETTIHDIARELDVSASTVSRALKNNPLISEKTREKIKQVAIEMGYRPNVVASNLRTRRTNTLGVIVPLINRHFFSSVISGVEEVAYKAGFAVTISQSNDDFQKESQIAQALFASRVDGVILSASMETITSQHLNLFTDRNIPLVFFDRVLDDVAANKIVVDDFRGGLLATRHLIEQGCRHIAHIGGPLNLAIYRDRLNGYLKALSQAGLQPLSEGVLHNRLTRSDGDEAIRQLMKLPQLPDAIFCANDTTALSVIIYLRQQKIRIPEDVALVGFSNEPFSEVVSPALSTIKQPGYEMGLKAAELIIRQINGELSANDFTTYVMPTELIIRESSLHQGVVIA